MPAHEDTLTNSQIAELLAIAGEDAKPPTGCIVGRPGKHCCGRKKLDAYIRKGGAH